ncbi:MAG: UPF0280 family protein [Deltaproteobacteria bacterium]|nr:UPF0280 family protein [Deltaproteobacteria bacterium]
MNRSVTTEYGKRSYRERVKAGGMVFFNVVVKETDLWVSSDRDLSDETRDLVFKCRHHLEGYIQHHPDFLTTLKPYKDDPFAPAIVRDMIRSTADIGVGPMASVAGAISQFVGAGLMEFSEQVIVENGGDIFLKTNRKASISIYAGQSPLSEKIGLRIYPEQMPVGVCSSSGTIGHSLSMGMADAVCILSSSASRADGAATAIGNSIRSKKDLANVTDRAKRIEGISGGVVIMDDRMAAWGDIELIDL